MAEMEKTYEEKQGYLEQKITEYSTKNSKKKENDVRKEEREDSNQSIRIDKIVVSFKK